MKILLNGKEFVSEAATLSVAALIELKNLPPYGIAVAVNNHIVRKADWQSTGLADGDRVTVITAVCGG